ncbi:MAG: hypothetical protein D6725_17010, partial [Planctomycetota bacterium]
MIGRCTPRSTGVASGRRTAPRHLAHEQPEDDTMFRSMRHARPLFALAAVLLCGTTGLRAELKLASPFRDHMVLQQQTQIRVWGWADPETQVTVAFGDRQASTTSGKDGRWMIHLDALPASAEPRTLVVETPNERQAVEDVLVGEVWLCSGQSNMAMT